MGWLKEITMGIPFAEEPACLHFSTMKDRNLVPPEERVISDKAARVVFLPNKLIRYLLDALANARFLRRLHLIIPPYWSSYAYHPSDFNPIGANVR
jgi:hypothetical protein